MIELNYPKKIDVGTQFTIQVHASQAKLGFLSFRRDDSGEHRGVVRFEGSTLSHKINATSPGVYEIKVDVIDRNGRHHECQKRHTLRVLGENDSAHGREQEFEMQHTRVAPSRMQPTAAGRLPTSPENLEVFGYTFYSPPYRDLCMDAVHSFLKHAKVPCLVLETANDGNYDCKFQIARLLPDQVGKEDIRSLMLFMPDGSSVDYASKLPLTNQQIIYFDNDVRFIRDFDANGFRQMANEFLAVKDCENHHCGPHNSPGNFGFHDCKTLGINTEDYFNGGFAVWGPSHYSMMRRVLTQLHEKNSSLLRKLKDFGEQSIWNYIAQKNADVRLLPVEFNTMISGCGSNFRSICEDPVMIHAAGIASDQKKKWLDRATGVYDRSRQGVLPAAEAFAKAVEQTKISKSSLTWRQKVVHEGEVVEHPITGMTCNRTQMLINNLCRYSRNYLEVGTFHGATLIAASYGNELDWALGYEQFNYDHGNPWGTASEATLKDNLNRHASSACYSKKPFLSDDLPSDIDVCFFDGPFDETFRSISRLITYLADDCVLLVDDWNSEQRQQETKQALESQDRFEIAQVTEFPTYWNGVAAFILEAIVK